MRITFVINSLRLGGAQRALINVAEAFDQHGHSVSLVTIYGHETHFFTLSEKINTIALGMAGDTAGLVNKIMANTRRIVALRRIILSTKPGTVISFLPETNISVLLALVGQHVPTFIVEETIPARQEIPRIWQWLRRVVYPLATALVCASRGIRDSFRWMPARQKTVIYNAFAAPNDGVVPQPHQYRQPARRHLISMGRLHPVKGFDLLLDAVSRIAANQPDWDLTIWGEGSERAALEAQIQRLGLQDRVFLPGATTDPLGVMQAAHLFVLSSRYEGFGNVLIEAMASGLPVVSFDCPSGPAEIIQDGVNGVLIPPQDVEQLAAVLDRLITNDGERQSLAAHSRVGLERFGIEAIFRQWNALLQGVHAR